MTIGLPFKGLVSWRSAYVAMFHARGATFFPSPLAGRGVGGEPRPGDNERGLEFENVLPLPSPQAGRGRRASRNYRALESARSSRIVSVSAPSQTVRRR